jgi:hypothetical protein
MKLAHDPEVFIVSISAFGEQTLAQLPYKKEESSFIDFKQASELNQIDPSVFSKLKMVMLVGEDASVVQATLEKIEKCLTDDCVAVCISTQHLLFDADTPPSQAFVVVRDTQEAAKAMQLLLDMIAKVGLLRVDMIDVQHNLRGRSFTFFDIAVTVENRISGRYSLDNVPESMGKLFSIYADDSLGMFEVNEIAKRLDERTFPDGGMMFNAFSPIETSEGLLHIYLLA